MMHETYKEWIVEVKRKVRSSQIKAAIADSDLARWRV